MTGRCTPETAAVLRRRADLAPCLRRIQGNTSYLTALTPSSNCLKRSCRNWTLFSLEVIDNLLVRLFIRSLMYSIIAIESVHTDSPDLSPTVTRPPDAQRSPPLTPTNRSPPSPHTPLPESDSPPAAQEDVIISLVETQQSDTAGAESDAVVQEPPPTTPPLPSSHPADSSPVMRGEENKGRLRKSETDLLTLSQALEAGSSLPTDTQSGTESGDELTPSLARKKQGGECGPDLAMGC